MQVFTSPRTRFYQYISLKPFLFRYTYRFLKCRLITRLTVIFANHSSNFRISAAVSCVAFSVIIDRARNISGNRPHLVLCIAMLPGKKTQQQQQQQLAHCMSSVLVARYFSPAARRFVGKKINRWT